MAEPVANLENICLAYGQSNLNFKNSALSEQKLSALNTLQGWQSAKIIMQIISLSPPTNYMRQVPYNPHFPVVKPRLSKGSRLYEEVESECRNKHSGFIICDLNHLISQL